MNIKARKNNLLMIITSVALYSCNVAFAAPMLPDLEMQTALEEAAANQQIYDETLNGISKGAYQDILRNIEDDRAKLIAALQEQIEAAKTAGNHSKVQSLENMLMNVLQGRDSFKEAYMADRPLAAIDSTADYAALQNILQQYDQDILFVQQKIEEYNRLIAEQKEEAIQYLNAHPEEYAKQQFLLPNVPNGTPATIFLISHGSYYINAGRYSGVSAGARYSIFNESDNYIGSLQIVKVSEEYSAGVLIQSQDIPINSLIGGVVTRKKPIHASR